MDEAHVGRPRITVWGVTPADPPYRLVQVGETVVGTAHDLADVVRLAMHRGVRHIDVDDPEVVNWVGGDKYTWAP